MTLGILGAADGLESSTFEHLAAELGVAFGSDGRISLALELDLGEVGFAQVRYRLFVEGSIGVVDLGEEFGIGLFLRLGLGGVVVLGGSRHGMCDDERGADV